MKVLLRIGSSALCSSCAGLSFSLLADFINCQITAVTIGWKRFDANLTYLSSQIESLK